MQTLPIDSIENEFVEIVSNHQNVILKASPGSGKTTRIPLFLKKSTNKKILVLEPRRLAAKLAATHVARSLGEEVGKTVGYKFRFENKTSTSTQILFLTEGTFLRMLSEEHALRDVDYIILDEFHERHLSTDASLSFINKIRSDKNLSLKLIVMSATIDTQNLESFLTQSGATKCIDLTAKRFNLHTQYLPNTTSIIQAP
jgi:ATP-dependent helicase HrpB